MSLVGSPLMADPAKSTLQLSAQFSDHMVIQRDMPVPVWGKATPGEKVVVQFGEASIDGTVDPSGRWRVSFQPMPASAEPRELVIAVGEGATRNERRIADVLVGEVWLCSGQSNMAYRLGKLPSTEKDTAGANDPLLRRFNVSQRPAERPSEFITDSEWVPCTPESAGEWSAVAFYFAQRLRAELKVPIGILLPAWGGSSVATWMSTEAIESSELHTLVPEDLIGWRQNVQPYRVYNGMLRPLAPYAIKGVVWYQGETEGTEYQGAYRNAYLYRKLFPAMVEDWRRTWGRPDLPFYWVQLPNLANPRLNWPVVRESQAEAQRLPHTGMIPAIDVGDDGDLHPKVKRPLADRVANFVLAGQYGMGSPAECATFASLKNEGASLRLSFNGTGKALRTTDDKLPRAFKVAAEDGKYHDADARIEGREIVLTSGVVSKPTTVRYAWDQAPGVNLVNEAGLPVVPFRTDALLVVGQEMTWRDLPAKRDLATLTTGGELGKAVQSAGWVASSADMDVAALLKDKNFVVASPNACQIQILDRPTRGRTESPTLMWTTTESGPAATFDSTKGITAEVRLQPTVVGDPLRGFDVEVGLKQADGRLMRYLISIAPMRLNAFRRNELWKFRSDLDNARERGTYRLAIRPDGVAQIYLDGERIGLLPGELVDGAKGAKSYVKIGKVFEGGEYIVTLFHVSVDTSGAYAPE